MNPPNLLSLLRLAAAPLLVFILASPSPTRSWLALGLYLAASLTDVIDGYLARKYNMVTNLGKFLDPVADKLINLAALLALIPLGRVAAWMVFLLVARDMAITGLRAVAADQGVVIAASSLGKLKTLAQFLALVLLLAPAPLLGLDNHLLGLAMLWLALVVTYWSGLDYLVRFFRQAA